MTDEKPMTEPPSPPAGAYRPELEVAPAPHVATRSHSTRRMMADVLLAMLPMTVMAVIHFRLFAMAHLGVCIASCLAAEWLFTRMRGKPSSLWDFSAVVTGAILAFSLPWNAPWWVDAIASLVGIGVGKAVFGGIGQNIFNPAMVGRAFVMIAFGGIMGGAAYQYIGDAAPLTLVTQATPLSHAKTLQHASEFIWPLLVGNHNGSIGETSVLACLLGGLYLCWRKTASWQIPAAMIAVVAALSGLANKINPVVYHNALFSLTSGAVVFGAFFIATDPVSSPLTTRGKWIFGAGVGFFTWVIRTFSGYPEGVMFAVLLMNAVVPLINRWTIPVPVGGREPLPAKGGQL